MKNVTLTLIAFFLSLISFSQCENDSINPYFVNFEPEITISCDVDLSVVFPVALDECDDSVEIAWYEEVTPGLFASNYDIMRLYRAYDDNGNQSVEMQFIHVVDETAPLFSSIENLTIDCTDSVVFTTPQVTDNCNEFTLTSFDIIEYGYNSCSTQYIRIWEATDIVGNSSMTTQTITSTDLTPPIITGQIYLELSDSVNIDSIFVTVTDNCSIPTISYSDVETSGNNIIRTYTATDYCGNISTFEQIIHIDVVVPPGDDDNEDDSTNVAICHGLGNGNWITIYVAPQAVDAHLEHGDYLGPCQEDDEGNNNRVAICHRTGNGSYHTIYVAPQAVPAHLAHGDYLGPCTQMVIDWQSILPNSDLEMRVIKDYDNKYKKFVRVK